MYINDVIFKKIIDSNIENPMICTFIKFLLYTGSRLVEALDIIPQNISLNNCCIRINNKRKRTREFEYYRDITVPKEFIEELNTLILNNHLKNNDKIFKFTSKTAINYIHLACVSAGLHEHITPKTFRISFAKRHILNGIDNFELNYLLGNVDIKKTILLRNLISEKNIV